MFLSISVRAQDAPKSPPSDAEATPAKAKEKEKETQPAPPAAETDEQPAAAPEPPGGLERLPAVAFWPPPYLRGLYGSSVWLSTGLHGLQWPYYRKTGIGFSGDVWVDNSYESVARQTNLMNKTEPDDKKWIQQARLVLRVTPTYTRGNWFVQGQTELVAFKEQGTSENIPNVADTDDLWVRTGAWNKWDVQVGRFQGWEVYHLGMGLDLNTVERQGATDPSPNPPPELYGVTYNYYRQSGPAGSLAFHGYPSQFLRFEVKGDLGNVSGHNVLGGRAAAILDLGFLKFKAAGEYRKQSETDPKLLQKLTQYGAGAGLILIFDPWIELGANAALGRTDGVNTTGDHDPTGSFNIVSVGGFANVRLVEDLLLGLGADYTAKEDDHQDTTKGIYGRFTHLQAFGALQYWLGKQLMIKAVFAYAKGHIAPTLSGDPYDNTMISARLRLQYLF
jgi:hypothetical protein